jgi:hypothetical protein
MATQSGQVTFPNPWVPPAHAPIPTTTNPESIARASRRRNRREYDEDDDIDRSKPHHITVKADGEIDAGCEGKNAWDDSVRGYVPKIIDVSIIHWEEHKPETLHKLRETLDAEFQYLNHPLSAIGFRNAIKRFLKTERSRLKARFLAGNDICPPHVQPKSWERLKAYWMTDLQQLKAVKMATARKHVKNYSSMGRKGRDGREAQLVSACILTMSPKS